MSPILAGRSFTTEPPVCLLLLGRKFSGLNLSGFKTNQFVLDFVCDAQISAFLILFLKLLIPEVYWVF